jgi:hypothetical protein
MMTPKERQLQIVLNSKLGFYVRVEALRWLELNDDDGLAPYDVACHEYGSDELNEAVAEYRRRYCLTVQGWAASGSLSTARRCPALPGGV